MSDPSVRFQEQDRGTMELSEVPTVPMTWEAGAQELELT